jgi:DNA-binding MarR family transcriptional regulator
MTYAEDSFEQLSQLVMKHRGLVPDRVDRSTRGESVILRLLGKMGSQTPSQLSKITGLSSGRVSSLLKALEEKGFIHRFTDDHDRRNVHVEITEAGREHNKAVYKMMQDDICWVFEQMGQEQTSEFIRLCSLFAKYSSFRFQMRVGEAVSEAGVSTIADW